MPAPAPLVREHRCVGMQQRWHAASPWGHNPHSASRRLAAVALARSPAEAPAPVAPEAEAAAVVEEPPVKDEELAAEEVRAAAAVAASP